MKQPLIHPNNAIWKLLEKLDQTKGVTELIINDLDSIFIERHGDLSALDISVGVKELNQFIQDVVNYNKKSFDQEHPLFDGVLPAGQRINMIASAYTNGVPAITIRRYDKSFRNLKQAAQAFSIDEDWAEFLERCVAARKNIVVSGGTGSGKTTFLNALLGEVLDSQRIITIEDTRELSFHHPNIVRLESKQAIGGLGCFELVKNALRMRPDRIILGEIRSGEIFDLLQAMNTGHDGSMTTIHANSTKECLTRMENLFYFAGIADVPVRVIREQIVSAVDLIIQLYRIRDGRRVIGQISELTQMEGDRVTMSDLGVRVGDKMQFSTIVPTFMGQLIDLGMDADFFDRN